MANAAALQTPFQLHSHDLQRGIICLRVSTAKSLYAFDNSAFRFFPISLLSFICLRFSSVIVVNPFLSGFPVISLVISVGPGAAVGHGGRGRGGSAAGSLGCQPGKSPVAASGSAAEGSPAGLRVALEGCGPSWVPARALGECCGSGSASDRCRRRSSPY